MSDNNVFNSNQIDIFSCPYGDCQIEDQFNNAIEIANLGLWEWDIKTNKVVFSAKAFDIGGLSKEKFNNTLDMIINEFIHEDSKAEFLNSVNSIYEKGVVLNNVYRVNHPLKTECWIKFRSKVHLDVNNKPIKLNGVIMDVTEEFIAKRALQNDLDFVKILMELIPNPIFYKNRVGHYKYFNKAFEDYLGLKEEELLNKSVYDIAPKNLANIYRTADEDLFKSKGKQVYESKVRYADGTLRHVIFRKGVHVNEKDEAIGLIGIMEDITDIKQMEEKLTMLSQVKEIFLKLNNHLIYYKDEATFLIESLKAFKEIFKLADNAILLDFERNISIEYEDGLVIPKDFDDASLMKAYNWYYENNLQESVHVITPNHIKIENKLSSLLPLFEINKLSAAMTIPILDGDQVKWAFCYTSTDNNMLQDMDAEVSTYIREQMTIMFKAFKLYKRTIFMSRYDGLTGLMNRVYFDENLEKSINTAYEEKKEFSVVMFDLDNLKQINDLYGHLEGDQFILRFTNLLKTNYENTEYFGRIGGDEFLGVFGKITGDQLNSEINKLKLEFIKSENLINHKVKGSFSFGVSTYPASGTTLKTLIKEADKKMYIDKTRSKLSNE